MTGNVTFKGASLLFVAVFVGVFAALWLDKYLERQSALVALGDAGNRLIDVGYGLEGAPFDFSEAARLVIPSVVSIDTAAKVESFLGMRYQRANSGSGVVFQSDGYIITNAHVVRDPNARGEIRPIDLVTVRTSDGQAYDATVVGIDELSDLAVIKVDASNLLPATLGKSDMIQVGEWVIAVGNQLGFSNSVSVGVVSSKNRWLETTDDTILIDAIQTDAAINRGNSGGALCNSAGEVIGINTSIAVDPIAGVSEGIGFAVPIEHVQRVASDLLQFGRVKYAILGIAPSSANLSLSVPQNRFYLAQLVEAPEPPDYGIVIDQTYAGLPAADAGVRQYDVLMEIDGIRLYSNLDYQRIMISKRPEEEVDLTIWSRGETREITVTLSARPN